MLGGHLAEPAGLVVLEGLGHLVPGVHHERPVGEHRLADGPPAEHEHVERRACADPRRPTADRVSESPGPNTASWPVAPGAAPRPPCRRRPARRPSALNSGRQGRSAGAGRQRGVHHGHRRVGRPRAVVTVELPGDEPEQRTAVGRGEQRDVAACDVLVARGDHLVGATAGSPRAGSRGTARRTPPAPRAAPRCGGCQRRRSSTGCPRW